MTSPLFILLSLLRLDLLASFTSAYSNCRVGRESSSWIDFDFSASNYGRAWCRRRRRAWSQPIQSTG